MTKKEDVKCDNSIDSKVVNNSEPSWYHYVIVLLVFVLIFIGIYHFFIVNNDSNNSNLNSGEISNHVVVNENGTILNTSSNINEIFSNVYKFETELSTGTKINLDLNSPVSELKDWNITLGLNKFDLLNSKNISFSFMSYDNSDDNFLISKSAIKFMRFLRYVYGIKFSPNNFASDDIINCSTSSIEDKVFVFDPYLNESGIFYNETSGCVIVGSDSAVGILKVLDKYMYELALIS